MAVQALPDIDLAYGIALGFDSGLEKHRFGNNYSQAYLDGVNTNRQTWAVGWDGRSDEEHDALRTFFFELGTDLVSWTPEGQDTPLNFHPVRNSWRSSKDKWNCWSIRIELEQSFDND